VVDEWNDTTGESVLLNAIPFASIAASSPFVYRPRSDQPGWTGEDLHPSNWVNPTAIQIKSARSTF